MVELIVVAGLLFVAYKLYTRNKSGTKPSTGGTLPRNPDDRIER